MVLDYWFAVFKRALTDSFKWLGVNPNKSLATFICTLIAASLLSYFIGIDKAQDKLTWYGLSLIAFLVLFITVFFLVFLFSAVPKLDQEHRQNQAALQDLIQTLQAEIEKWKANCEAIRNADPATSMKRDVIRGFIHKFEALISSFNAGQPNSIGQLHAVDNSAKAYIRDHFQAFQEYNQKHTIGDSYTQKAHLTPADIASYVTICEYKLRALTNLLSYLN